MEFLPEHVKGGEILRHAKNWLANDLDHNAVVVSALCAMCIIFDRVQLYICDWKACLFVKCSYWLLRISLFLCFNERCPWSFIYLTHLSSVPVNTFIIYCTYFTLSPNSLKLMLFVDYVTQNITHLILYFSNLAAIRITHWDRDKTDVIL